MIPGKRKHFYTYWPNNLQCNLSNYSFTLSINFNMKITLKIISILCCVYFSVFFTNESLCLGFQLRVEVVSFPKLSKTQQKTNTTVMMKWIDEIPPGNLIQLVAVNQSVCVSHWGNNSEFCLSLVGFNPRPCLPVGATEMEGRGRCRYFVFHSLSSLPSHPRWDHLPSQLKAFVCAHRWFL